MNQPDYDEPTAAFNPARLTLARQSLGWTKTRLAGEAGITARRLADYENRGDTPPAPTIETLADKLRVASAFFGLSDPTTPHNVSFRSMRSTSAATRDMALAAASMTTEVAGWIEARFHLESVSLPDDLAGTEPMLAAQVVREQWGLGLHPAPNLIHLVELMGVRVFALAIDSRTLDAFSFWDDATPYILINARGSAERRRWDVAHEVGHLLLHAGSHHIPADRGREDEADAFASELLLPAEGLRRNRIRVRRLDEVRSHKLHWRVSAISLIRQLRRLGYLTEWEYRNLAIEASKARLRRTEGDIPAEMSPVLAGVLNELRTRRLGPHAVARDLHLRSGDVRNMFHGLAPVGIDGNPSVSPNAQRPNLRLVP